MSAANFQAVHIIYLIFVQFFSNCNYLISYTFAIPSTSSYKLNVTPTCGEEFIKIVLEMNNHVTDERMQFNDWIIVGSNNRNECRLKGNGESQYVIEIAIFNDPCGSEMLASGIYQSKVRIAQNPSVILYGDQNLLVRCLHGTPEINHLAAPFFNSSFKAVTLQDSPRNSLAIVPASATENEYLPNDTSIAMPWLLLLPVVFIILLAIALFILLIICAKWRMQTANEQNVGSENTSGATLKDQIYWSWWNSKNTRQRSSSWHNEIDQTRNRDESIKHSTCNLNMEIAVPAHAALKTEQLSKHLDSVGSNDYQPNTDSTIDIAESAFSFATSSSRENMQLKDSPFSYNMDHKLFAAELSEARSITEIYHSSAMEADSSRSAFDASLESKNIDVTFNDRLIKCVDKIRGFGPKKLTEQELGRWRRLVINDENFCYNVSKAKSLNKLEEICFSHKYVGIFPEQKWRNIIECILSLLKMSFSVSDQIDDTYKNTNRDLSSLNVYVGEVFQPDW